MSSYKETSALISSVIEKQYGVIVKVCDVLDPNTGDFDGQHVFVDYALDEENTLFVLLHLFGHTVQWNTSEALRQIGLDSKPGKTAAELGPIYNYECDATRYGLTLLHDAGITDLDRWVSDWFYADWEFLKRFYTTGERTETRSHFRPGVGAVLTALPIPAFKPKKFSTRFAF
jgi:hypothetical protein